MVHSLAAMRWLYKTRRENPYACVGDESPILDVFPDASPNGYNIIGGNHMKLSKEQKAHIDKIQLDLKEMKKPSRAYDYVCEVLKEILIYRYFFDLYRRACSNHVLKLEADMPIEMKYVVFHLSDLVRQAGNRLVESINNSLREMKRTKEYKNLAKEYAKTNDKDRKKELGKQFDEIHKKYGLTKDRCIKEMQEYAKEFDIPSVMALVKAEDIWTGLDKVIHSDGKTLHFRSFTELPALCAKQIEKCIILHYDESGIWFSFNSRGETFRFTALPGDRFIQDELAKLEEYLKADLEMRKRLGKSGRINVNDRDLPEERDAVTEYVSTGNARGIFRPCYVSLVPERIRGKHRVFIQITIEGLPVQKLDKDGMPRHIWATSGLVGCDIGAQTAATYDGKNADLRNLGERGPAIWDYEAEERRIQRAMERSCRAMNPEYYNEDGTIKKGKKRWKKSKRYIRLMKRLSIIRRLNRLNRMYANYEYANSLRERYLEFITEPKNSSKIARKAKKATKNEKTGRFNRRKRSGHSIQSRCPGQFQAKVKQLFTSTGGIYQEVDGTRFRASQFDPTTGQYTKHDPSERMIKPGNGDKALQRDMLSAFNLYWSDSTYSMIDEKNAMTGYAAFRRANDRAVEMIRRNGKKVANSGIRI